MEPDASLQWIRRLCAELDAAVESGLEPNVNAVYALVGLVEELDRWLAAGRSPPARWRDAFHRTILGSIVFSAPPPSNDTRPHAPRRARRRARDNGAQLALELDAVRA